MVRPQIGIEKNTLAMLKIEAEKRGKTLNILLTEFILRGYQALQLEEPLDETIINI
jgi:hypothetical protein